MAELFAYLAGLLLAAGVYLVVQPQPVRMLFGVVLIGNAMNLGIMAVGRTHSGVPPIIPSGADAPLGAVANPLPQALVLTALVISFGLTAFALALIARVARADDAASIPVPGSGRAAPANPSLDPVPPAMAAGTAGVGRANGREKGRGGASP